MKTDMLNPDGSVNQLALPKLDGPNLYTKKDANRRALKILDQFKNKHKTESAFYLAFRRLHSNDIDFMASFWNLKRDFEVFKRICSIYNVRNA